MSIIEPNEVNDFSVPSDSRRTTTMTLSREAARQVVEVSCAADVAALTPQEARYALNAKYSAVMGDATTRPNRARLIELVIDPFLAALPDVVEGREDDENSRRLLAEIMAIVVGLRIADSSAIRLPSTFDPADPETLDETPTNVTVTLGVPSARFVVGPNYLERIDRLARRGGVWLMLAENKTLGEMEASDPVAVLNAIAEIQQYAAAVTFKVKLDSQQLKMLQAFFRSA